MGRSIARVTLVVRDTDEAIAFFTAALRFTVSEDTPLGHGKHCSWSRRPMTVGQPCCWPGPPPLSRQRASATGPAAASPCSCTPTTSGPTTGTCGWARSSQTHLKHAR
jgi:catechol 2,3-dioxygenase-like lactoylglutathione lyase family enzyme